ncbi:hypothetical protein IV38_GL001886 [Lactobacillus selangorensis]|uniref:Uncharacterized protein n=1 Tax=Lactobacillus selangorensis TaxID=81857 RepID=A0A0R2FXR1_9LACO|nr:DUF1361 domain-containing protein [Lactobacillus selangorensis]KRN27674.1 hypothetical protein IV38_GL001886 [Lactobacillus selangorensis]KRN30359.1 hypothetical protein IV40_GL001948 [Lactobacillus selangorensis]
MNKKLMWSIRGCFLLYFIYLFLFVQGTFSFLLLNTFLGYIPIELAFHLHPDKPRSNWLFWPITVLWLLFFPNAPYLLTDLIHLTLLHAYNLSTGLIRNDPYIWINFTYLLISTVVCTNLGMWSVNHVANVMLARFHWPSKRTKLVFVPLLLLLSSIGIYIGRFLRIHTVYLLTPSLIIKPILTMWSPRMLLFTFLLFIVQMMIYGTLEIFKHSH